MSLYRSGAPTGASDIYRVVIAIATYKRPDLLRDLLRACTAQARELEQQIRIIVVDNDPAETAHSTCDGFGDVDYFVEPRSGIAAARNRALAELRDEDDAVIFVDDDEIPTHRWLETLVTYAIRTGADVVTGPVQPILDETVPHWISRGGFWRRADQPTGTSPASVATNNTLMRLKCWRLDPVQFSEELSLKGGSDTEFFRQLRGSRGVLVLWCHNAVVEERVLPERANARWLFRRAIRIGNINARYRAPSSALGGGLARVVIGVPYISLDWLRNRQFLARSFNMLAHGVGMIGQVLDRDVVEYRRVEEET